MDKKFSRYEDTDGLLITWGIILALILFIGIMYTLYKYDAQSTNRLNVNTEINIPSPRLIIVPKECVSYCSKKYWEPYVEASGYVVGLDDSHENLAARNESACLADCASSLRFCDLKLENIWGRYDF